MNCIKKSASVAETTMLAETLAAHCKGGEVIQLIGDVGAGKTTFVKAFAEALESKDHVSSPTFTICNTYHGRLTIQHCDFYRLQDDVLIEHELGELIDQYTVVLLEWAENIPAFLKNRQTTLSIINDGEQKRTFVLNAPEPYTYLKI